MRRNTNFVRPLSVMVTIIVVVLVVVSAGFLRHSVAAQEQSLLQSDTSQLALTLDQAVAAIGPPLSALGEVMAATQDLPSLFQSQAKLIAARPGTSVAVADAVAGRYTVDLAAGPDFVVGQALPAPLATAAASAGPKISTTKVLHVGDKTFLGFLVSTVSGPQGTVVIELEEIHPSVPIASAANPYGDLNFGLYAAETADPAQLVLGSLGSRPLPGTVAHSFITVGSSKWLVVASAKTPLVGGASRLTPWIVLAAGLVIALLIGTTSEILARRRRYAEELVEERTLEVTTAHAAADAANRSKSEFLSRMSHELRTPLNAVLGFGQLLELDELSDDQRDAVDHILKGGRHLLDLINEVLDISRIETGELSLSSEAVLAADLVREAVDLMRPLADQRGIQLMVAGSGGSDCYVFADRQRVKQVLLNLLSNAVKYNRPRGTIVVSCEQSGATRVRISVADTGMGIPAERLGLLFTPFERLGAEQTAEEGTGIGLALSKRLAEAMDGTLEAISTLGQGSTFTVELPRVEEPVERYERLHGGAQPAVEAAAQRRVLLHVEDNLSNLALIERVLAQRPGVEVVAAMQGSLALELAREHHPVLVLLDLHLPDMGGEQVLQRLRDDPDTASIPVVIASADATPGHVQRLLSAGAAAYLTKPIDVLELLRLIDEAVEDR